MVKMNKEPQKEKKVTKKGKNKASTETIKSRWRKCECVILDATNETLPTDLEETHPHWPDLKPFEIFNLFFTPEMISEFTTETIRYAHSKNNHTFSVTDRDIYHFLGLILISGYHSLTWRNRSLVHYAFYECSYLF